MLDRLIDIGEGLRLNPLRSVNDEQCAFASRQTARNFIGKIDVAGRIHQIELIGFAILRLIVETHSLRLNRDAAFTLNIHIVEHLLAHLAL